MSFVRIILYLHGVKQILIDNYGFLFEDALLEEIAEVGILKDVKKGYVLMEIGEYVKTMPLLVSGAIRIIRKDKDDNEILLYFLEKGDTCAMTLTCCLGEKKSEIRSIAETDATIIMIPVAKMEEWTGRYKSWRDFVFNSYHSRLMEMFETFDSIAFLKLDERLLKYLRDKAMVNSDELIHNTHHEIAQALNTSRVVVSRLLKKLENQGKIELFRNKIRVVEL